MRSMMKMVKGVGVGLALGSVMGAIGGYYLYSNRKCVKRNVGKALRSVGDLADSITGFF